MSLKTSIQWCDGTTNPVAACDGCPLWPGEAVFKPAVATLLMNHIRGANRTAIAPTLDALWKATLLPSRKRHVATFVQSAFAQLAPEVPAGVIKNYTGELLLRLRCYAGLMTHRFGGHSKGYAISFDIPQLFPGRMAEAAAWREPVVSDRIDKPWLIGARRLIFVSDMGDALSDSVPFDYLEREIVRNVASANGRRHIFLWLTKRPARMADFWHWLDKRNIPWPQNLVPMSSILNTAYAQQALRLLEIPAVGRGFSVEPLDNPLVLPEALLAAKPWIIVGGESGLAGDRHPFDLAWARSIRDQCAAAGAPFFLKQLGSAPIENGARLHLCDSHGGDWNEWPLDLRMRQIPSVFLQAA